MQLAVSNAKSLVDDADVKTALKKGVALVAQVPVASITLALELEPSSELSTTADPHRNDPVLPLQSSLASLDGSAHSKQDQQLAQTRLSEDVGVVNMEYTATPDSDTPASSILSHVQSFGAAAMTNVFAVELQASAPTAWITSVESASLANTFQVNVTNSIATVVSELVIAHSALETTTPRLEWKRIDYSAKGDASTNSIDLTALLLVMCFAAV